MSESAQSFTTVVKALNDFLDYEPDYSKMPADEIRKILKEHDIDINQAVRDVKRLIFKKASSQRLEAARKLRQHLIGLFDSFQTGSKQLSDIADNKRQQILDEIKNKFGSVIPATYFRKLESLENQDLASLLDDLEILDRIDTENRDA